MFCIHCGKQIDDDALFCPECGMRTDVEHDGPEAAPGAKDQAAADLPRTDSAAGDAPQAPVDETPAEPEGTPAWEQAAAGGEAAPGAAYDPAPGTDSFAPVLQAVAAPKKKKKFILLAVILAVVLAAAGTVTWLVMDMQAKEQARIAAHEKYLEDAQSFCSLLLDTAVDLEDIGREIYDRWYDYVFKRRYSSPDAAIDAAQLAMSSEMTSAERGQLILKQLYEDLMTVPDENNETQQALQLQIKRTYTAFMDFYDFIMSPTGSYSTFKDTYNEKDGETADRYKELKDMLDKAE